MPKPDPPHNDYIAVVSEWSSQRTGYVGNAYPIFDASNNRVVADPEDEFANPGAVFLPNRSGLETWDFVRLRPKANSQYHDSGDRDCFYVPSRSPQVLNLPDHLPTLAAVLDHPAFDPKANHRQLLNPAHNVTPLFYVRRGSQFFGPLIRDGFQRSLSDDIERIDWRPAGDDGIIYEGTAEHLAAKDVRLVQYQHPVPHRNRVIEHPLALLVGNVLDARAGKPHDTLPPAAVVEWYQRNYPAEGAPAVPARLQRPEAPLPPSIVAARRFVVEKEFLDNAAFQEHRERLTRTFLDSDAGRKHIEAVIGQTVERKASEMQADVDRQEAALAARRDDLKRNLDAAEAEHRARLGNLETEGAAAAAKLGELRSASQELQRLIGEDAGTLATKMREQIPLIAALTGTRNDGQTIAPPSVPVVRAAPPPVVPAVRFRDVTDERRLVDDLHADLSRRGLNFTRDFVANVYTCLKAESLNLVIGPPGYGKSMLVTHLARSLGHGDAFLPITVRRSWADDRHLLGFYDTFNNRYDPGPTRLVPRMMAAAADWARDRQGVYVVLLDEFNLAAPEYYFAQLLQTLPADDADRELALYDPAATPGGGGYPAAIKVGPNLRFWGTINYDETTERLSPRTLDRTGMIFLGDQDVRPSAGEGGAAMAGVAAKDLFGKFCRAPDDCPADAWELLTAVTDVLRTTDIGLGPKLELSPRVRKGIRRYLANAAGLLETKVAVDFAVQQRILPVLRGRGDEYLARIRRLAEVLAKESLTRSARHVEGALSRSESQFGDVDFLSY